MAGHGIPCVIGIDGGGTRSTAICVSTTGETLAQTEGRALNYHTTSLESFRRHLAELVGALKEKVTGEAEVVYAVVGTASLFDRAETAETRKACEGILPVESTLLLGDALVAAYGAMSGQPGILIVAGTGSIAACLDGHGIFHTAGGFGPLVGGDPGSAFWMASQAVMAAAQIGWDTGESTALSKAICDFFSVKSLHDIVKEVYGTSEGWGRLAGLAGHLAESRLARTSPFLEIQLEAGRRLASLARPLLKFIPSGDERIEFYGTGSVLRRNENVREALTAELTRMTGKRGVILSPSLGPARGAALLALKEAGQSITPGILQALQHTSP